MQRRCRTRWEQQGPQLPRGREQRETTTESTALHVAFVQRCLLQVYDTKDGWAFSYDGSADGHLVHAGTRSRWQGMKKPGSGATIGLLLDLQHGSLTVYENGKKLGQMIGAPLYASALHPIAC